VDDIFYDDDKAKRSAGGGARLRCLVEREAGGARSFFVFVVVVR